MAGTIGELLLLISFVASILAGLAYFQSVRRPNAAAALIRTGRLSWYVMLLGALGAAVILSRLIFTHQFQYNYVWSNSSRDLPAKYLFSAFWAGQEGSFLLWTVMIAIVGVIALHTSRRFEGPVMAILGLCQAFMISMIVGLKFGAFHIGSSPFSLLAERFPDAPFLAAGGVPPDGNGLNDLLQNYWMVIHPPTLFMGFTLMMMPFAFAVAGLWQKKYTQWVKPALPWVLTSTLVLLVGITLGGYWAYVTLSFGGYWAWDPVENSSFVPFLIGAAALHTMIAQKKSGSSHKASMLFCILAFMTVIYSTFLTRSGILGDVSVHSFVDLGLYNQLLIWILAIAALGFGLFAYRYRDLPVPKRESQVMSREFMIFTGALVLCAIATVVLLGTSTPIVGRIFRDSPSGVPIEFYNRWTLPMAVILALLVGVGQLFWWTKMSIDTLNRLVARPLVLAVLSTAAVLILTPFAEQTAQSAQVAAQAVGGTLLEAGFGAGLVDMWYQYGPGMLLLLLVFAAFFALYGNGFVLWRIGKGNIKLAGGAITHVGLALALFGIVTSSGLNDPIVPESHQGRRENFVVDRGQTVSVDGYAVSYEGTETTDEGYTAYRLNFNDGKGHAFQVKPVVYKSRKEQWIQHPDIKTYAEKDIYVSVAPKAMFEQPDEASASDGRLQLQLRKGESSSIADNKFEIAFDSFVLDVDSTNGHGQNSEISVSAKLRVKEVASGEEEVIEPVYVITANRQQRYMPASIDRWGMTVSFVGMNVDDGAVHLIVDGLGGAPEDWIVVQAYQKPLINLLWIGIFMMAGGFLLSIYRRVSENKHSKKRPA